MNGKPRAGSPGLFGWRRDFLQKGRKRPRHAVAPLIKPRRFDKVGSLPGFHAPFLHPCGWEVCNLADRSSGSRYKSVGSYHAALTHTAGWVAFAFRCKGGRLVSGIELYGGRGGIIPPRPHPESRIPRLIYPGIPRRHARTPRHPGWYRGTLRRPRPFPR